MRKKEAIQALKTWSEEFDKRWHATWSEGHDGHYRDLLDECMVRIDELEFQLSKKWYK